MALTFFYSHLVDILGAIITLEVWPEVQQLVWFWLFVCFIYAMHATTYMFVEHELVHKAPERRLSAWANNAHRLWVLFGIN